MVSGSAIILIYVKLLHTAVCFFFASCIVAIPFAAHARRFRWATILSVLVLGECSVLALNHFCCPLTDLASHYTNDRAANFDIYCRCGWLGITNSSSDHYL
jgi:hypothetical protein